MHALRSELVRKNQMPSLLVIQSKITFFIKFPSILFVPVPVCSLGSTKYKKSSNSILGTPFYILDPSTRRIPEQGACLCTLLAKYSIYFSVTQNAFYKSSILSVISICWCIFSNTLPKQIIPERIVY